MSESGHSSTKSKYTLGSSTGTGSFDSYLGHIEGKGWKFFKLCLSRIWNIRNLLVIVLSLIVIFSSTPILIISSSYNSMMISRNTMRIQNVTLMFVKSYAERTMNHIVDTNKKLEEAIYISLENTNVTIVNFTTNDLFFHNIFIPFVTSDAYLSNILFGYNNAGTTMIRKSSDTPGAIEKKFMEFDANGTRFQRIYRMDPIDHYYSTKMEMVFEREYVFGAASRPWFKDDSVDKYKWDISVAKTKTEVVVVSKTIFQNSKIAGKLGVVLRLNKLSDILDHELTDPTFLLSGDGKLIACSTFEDDKQRELKIYHVHEYVNQLIRDAGITLYEKFNQNYSSIENTDDNIRFKSEGRYYTMDHSVFTVECHNFIIVTLLDEKKANLESQKSFITIIVVSIALLVSSICVSIILSLLLSFPIWKISRKLKNLTCLILPDKKSVKKQHSHNWVFNLYEIRMIKESVEKLTQGLKNFTKFLPRKILKKLLKRNMEIRLGLKRTKGSTCFVDMVGFTHLAESHSAEVLIFVLSTFFTCAGEIVVKYGGIIDAYLGDEIFAIFREDEHEKRCVGCVREILSRIEKLNNINQRYPEIFLRAGIGSGQFLIGFIGCQTRVSYTCIGDIINVGSRLQTLNKEYGTEILITESTENAINDEYSCRWVDNIMLRGKKKLVNVYTVIGKYEELDEQVKQKWDKYNNMKLIVQECRGLEDATTLLNSCKVDDDMSPIFLGYNFFYLLRLIYFVRIYGQYLFFKRIFCT